MTGAAYDIALIIQQLSAVTKFKRVTAEQVALALLRAYPPIYENGSRASPADAQRGLLAIKAAVVPALVPLLAEAGYTVVADGPQIAPGTGPL